MSNLSDQPIRSDASCLFWDRSPGSIHVCYDLPAPAPGLDAGPGQSVPFNMGLAGIFRTGNKKLALVFHDLGLVPVAVVIHSIEIGQILFSTREG